MTITKLGIPSNLEITNKINEIIDAVDSTTPTSLGGLSDVSLTSASSGELLGFDGTNWVNTNKLSVSSVGDSTTPIYLDNGVPTALSYTIESSVPANAVFTDTTYTFSTGLTTSGTTISVTDYSKLIKDKSTPSTSLSIMGTGSTNQAHSINIGLDSAVKSNYSIAIGDGAVAGQSGSNYAIQIGSGTNSQGYSLYVGFGSGKNYCLLEGGYGKIPDDRISSNIARTSAIPTKISDLTDDTATYPIDKADTLTDLTASVTELNIMDGVTVTTADINSITSKIGLSSLSIDSGSSNYLSYSSSNGKFSAKVDTTVGTVSTNLITSGAVSTALSYKLSTVPDGTHDFLDSNNKININYLPDVVLGQMLYAGTFVPSTAVATLTSNAKIILGTSSDTITLTNNTTAITGYTANEGNYYIASASGSFASIDFETGDWLVSTGSAWKKISNTDAVTGVKGNAESSYRTGNVNITADNVLPSQTGNSGKYLTTNGSTASWASVPSVTVDQTYDGTSANAQSGVAIAGAGFLQNSGSGTNSLALLGTATGNRGIGLGQASEGTGAYSSGIGAGAKATANYSIQIGYGTNSTASSLFVGFNASSSANRTNWELLDGTTGLIPDSRLSSNIQLTSNLVTSVSSSSTNSQYPSAKLFYDTCGDIETLINAL